MQTGCTRSCRAPLGVTQQSIFLLHLLPPLHLHFHLHLLLLLLLLLLPLSTSLSPRARALAAASSILRSAATSNSTATHLFDRDASSPLLLREQANITACPNLRIAIFNGVQYHYEVLAGLAYILRRYERRTEIFLHRHTQREAGDGTWDILRRFRFKYHLLTHTRLAALARAKPFYDVVILVSPEYELRDLENVLVNIRRHVTVAIIHNSDFENMQRLIQVVESGSSSMRLVTLSPHNAATLAARLARRVEWTLPVYPFKPKVDCLDTPSLHTCLRGFSIQGKFSSVRRNYSTLWQQMASRYTKLTTGLTDTRFHVNLLGKGAENRLHLPQELQPLVTMHRRLPFEKFYNQLHHSLAIVPLFGSSRYHTHKFSSSIISSLISGTPLIASRRLLAAYSMLDERSVFVQEEEEQELDVMLRVMVMPKKDLLAVRQGVLEARQRVNGNATAFYTALLMESCGAAVSREGVGSTAERAV
ncbi:hypothetical protein Vretifemale_9679 [Volvox reticuliferus]|uniref:Uncharacterized protein n=1 Tax=Volvox reticuliferus TaxID=1737510 RepID=A0A8J4CIU0_9CHLO|nr:hypothetical protein Vretifemale_9679 [Volvox reticuliferus]